MTKTSLAWVVGFALVCCGALDAQISSGTLFGTVTDPTGAPVAGASVAATNTGTQTTRTVTTNSAGQYNIPDLNAAHYSITVKVSGFKTYTVPDIELQVAQREMLNAALQVGDLQQQVTVEATAPLLETAQSSVAQVVNPATVERMPLNGRSFWQLTSLTPGVTYTPGGQGTQTGGSSIRSKAVNVTIDGTAPNEVGWYLDGAFITEMQTGGTLVQPNVDAIQEFNVESANMSAEYGHTPNVVNVALKSGTNGIHGSGFEFLRNSAFDARNFFYVKPAGSDHTVEPLRRNQYGGTLGGPIRKDKVFFFVDVERTGLLQDVDFDNAVASLAERGGNFSQLLPGKAILNPTNYQPFPGNIIPASFISPQAQFFLPYMPLPNTVQGSTSYAALTNNLLQNETRGDARIDAQLTNSTQLTGRYSINQNNENDPNPYPALGTFALQSRAQDPTISLSHIFTPSLVNVARFSYYRSYFYFGAALPGTNFNQEAGVQGFNDTTSVYSFPEITVSGYSTFTGSPYDQRPKQNRIRDFQYADDLSYTIGRHSLKFGGELIHADAGFINGSSSVGIFAFNGQTSGDAFADLLLGYPYSVTRDYFKQLNGDNGNFWGVYAQDSFRVRPDLTLNLGVRLDLQGFYNGIRGQKSAFNLQTGKLIIPSSIDPQVQLLTSSLMQLFSDRIVYTNSLGLPDSIQPTRKNWAPRVGLAWRPGNSANFVIRSSFGIFYVFPDSNTINNTVATVPFIAATTILNNAPPALPARTWGNFFLGQPNVAPNPNPGQPCSFGFVANSCATPNVDSGSTVFHSETVNEWNFSIQRQLTASTSLDVAYVGNKTTHLNQNISINDPAPGPGAVQARRPYPQWGTITYADFNENANYNALQAKYETRNWHGLSTLVSYAWSKCIDSGTSQAGPTLLLTSSYRGVCDYDLPQTGAGSFDYVLPVGKGMTFLSNANRFVNAVLGGWEATGIVTLRAGLPFSPVISSDNANTGVGSQPAEVIGSPVITGSPTCWFYVASNSACKAQFPGGTAAFIVPTKYTYGNAGRNILRADGLKQFDFTMLKGFTLTERVRMQFRAEMFNILNHPTFSAPTTSINTSSGGQVTSTLNAARIIQLAVKVSF